MSEKKQSPIIIFVVGPTASGKSDWAMRAATLFRGDIVSCDSVQVYKEVNIGTAKPTLAERQQVQHYLVDFVAPPQEYSAADYRRDALEVLRQQEGNKNKLMLITGGTGFYFLALEKGMFDVEPVPENIVKEIDSAVADGRLDELYREIQLRDPEYACKISVNDRYRVGRALGLMRAQGLTMTEIRNRFNEKVNKFPYPVLKIGLTVERSRLSQRVKQRTRSMLQRGLIDEVQYLTQKSLAEWSPLQSVGYKEVLKYLSGEINQTQLEEEINLHTMQLAKRQMTWFRKDKDVHWFDSETEVQKALDFLQEHVATL